MQRFNPLKLCMLALLGILFLAASTYTQARGYYGHGGYYYGRGYGYGYGHSYGYSPYYGHSYSGYGYRHPYGYGYSHYPVYGLLSIPGRVISGLVGYPRHDSSYSATNSRNVVAYNSTHNTYSPSTTSSNTPVYGTDPGVNGRGWSLLAEGHDESALTYFATAAQSHPRNSIPKVGYALSAAGSGNLSRGIWAMRRAARIDPEGMRYLQLSDAHAGRVRHLLGQYQSRIEDSHYADDAFMVAALKYLLGELNGANAALTLATQYGDTSASTRNLAHLINDPPSGKQMSPVNARKSG